MLKGAFLDRGDGIDIQEPNRTRPQRERHGEHRWDRRNDSGRLLHQTVSIVPGNSRTVLLSSSWPLLLALEKVSPAPDNRVGQDDGLDCSGRAI